MRCGSTVAPDGPDEALRVRCIYPEHDQPVHMGFSCPDRCRQIVWPDECSIEALEVELLLRQVIR